MARVWITLIGIALVGATIGMLAAAYREETTWERFRVAQNCKEIGEVSGSSITTVGPIIGGNGGVSVGIGYIPGKTGWRCDDGKEYWR